MVRPVKKLIKLSKNPSNDEIVKKILAKFKQYASKYGSFYVGITVDANKRLKQHEAKLKKAGLPGWQKCYILWETSSDNRVKAIEKEVIAEVRKKYTTTAWNLIGGGTGRPPNNATKAVCYALLDEKETIWEYK